MSSPQASLIYILGAPGAGKGTLCTFLAQQYTNVFHLSVGDHLRYLLSQELSQSTPQTFGGLDHETFSSLMQQRQLLPAEAVVAIVDNAVKTISKTAAARQLGAPIILIDGFPLSHESAALADAVWGAPRSVFFFDCPRHMAEARFLNRRRSADDSVELFQIRCDEFERLNGGIVAMYRDIVVRVNTETGPEETWEDLMNKVGEMLKELGAF